MGKNNIILFLTGCVDPKGMAFTALNNPEIRRQQYIDTLNWYLDNTSLPILFVENTNVDLSNEFRHNLIQGRLEILTFDGNNYDRSLGKGYGEARIMQYGFEHSNFLLHEDAVIIKVTGRFICKNIEDLVKRYNCSNTIYANIGKDDWGGNIASSVFVIAPSEFWKNIFLPRREELNDSKFFHFEHLLYESLCTWSNDGGRHREFWILPVMIGVSGTSGKKISCNSSNRTIKSKLFYILHRFFNYRRYLNPFYKGKPHKLLEV